LPYPPCLPCPYLLLTALPCPACPACPARRAAAPSSRQRMNSPMCSLDAQ